VDRPLWTPSASRVRASNLAAFLELTRERSGVDVSDYAGLHRWSVTEPAHFWETVWEFCDVVGDRGDAVIAADVDFWKTRFFPDATLSYAENLLRRDDDGDALVFVREDGHRRVISWRALHELVSRLQQALRASGVARGDRVAAWLPNAPEAYALLLAASSIGAVFSSCSPDFGTQGVVDRFGQIEPAVLCAVDGYWYGGARFDCIERLRDIVPQLPSLQKVVILSYLDDAPEPASIRGAIGWDEWVGNHTTAPVEFTRLPFDQPLYVLYSSGTTGLPKCIVHRAGGVLIKHLVEHRLHADVRPDDRVFYFTTTGWMMWNWLASALASDAAVVVFDGAPVQGDDTPLWRLADSESITLFGTSAKFLETCQRLGLRPVQQHDLAPLRTITSTGSPLAPEGFEYVYRDVKADVHLASISGGTDLCGCLVAGDPTGPVWAGEIQRPGLGMAIDVVDDDARSLPPGRAGELVCTAPFPSMPVALWNDPGDARLRSTYFERFPGMWHQGDFAEWTEHGGVIIHGRSDATLNPGGVRIGTAEIYRQVEALDDVDESLAIAQRWGDDVRVVLFVVLRDGAQLTDELRTTIRDRIRSGASPRHVPARIVAVRDLPRTRSGKLSELAVRDVVHGAPVKNTEALANPESLEQFRHVEELAR
jgi:acetoacetyl-CoA synthetase